MVADKEKQIAMTTLVRGQDCRIYL